MPWGLEWIRLKDDRKLFFTFVFGLALIGLAKAALRYSHRNVYNDVPVSLVCRMLNMFCTVSKVRPEEKLYRITMKINGMYFIIFCCMGSMVGEVGVNRA